MVKFNLKIYLAYNKIIELLTLSVRFPRNPKYSLTISMIVNTI